MDLLELIQRSRPANLQQPRKWFDVQYTQGTAEILIYDVIGADWFGGISAREVVSEIGRIRHADRLRLRINSPGGDVADGIAIRNALIDHPAPVDTVIEGLAASTASWVGLLPPGRKGNTVKIAPNAMMMIHRAWGGFLGNADEIRRGAGVLDKWDADIVSMYEKKAGDSKPWFKLMDAETWYNDSEAVKAGLVDEVVGEPAPASKNRADPALVNLFLNLFRNTPRQLLEPAQAASNDLVRAELAYQRERARQLGVTVS